ncbi:MAG: hypothetical protein ACPG77_06235, partial [Nannocystaceae bacterium]
MSSTSASYLHLTMATHAGRNLMFGIDHKRAIYYAVQRAKPKIETTGFRLDPVDLETLKHQGLEGRDKLRPMLGKLYADEPKYLEALGKQLEAKVVDTHKSKLLAAARQTKTLIWHDWRFLELPHEPADESVTKREKADGTDSLICSLYNSHKDSASAGVQAVSSGEQLHVFRQSIRGTLLVDRFVLDLETNRLNRALEVRFRRSRKRYTPLASTSDTTLDSCDFRDADGKFFLAPSLELRMVENLSGGQFSVVVTPTQDHERARWHIFAWDSKAGHFRVTSLRSQKAGGFDVYDHTIVEGAAVDAKYRQVAGVICTNLTLKGPQNQVLTPSAPPSATRYDVQRKVEGNDGKSQVLRVARRVMLAVPTGSDGKVVTVSFAVHTDGTLSRVAGTPVDKLRAEKNESILLPADLLNRVDTRSASSVESPPAVARHGLHFNADGTCVANAAAPMDLKGRSFTIEFWARRRESNRTAFVFRQGPYGT